MTGFTFYDTPISTPQQTIQELLDGLSAEQKGDILNGFANRVKPVVLSDRKQLKYSVVKRLYEQIDAVEEKARSYMRGEVIIKEAVFEDGEEASPAEYNKPPTTANALKNLIVADFADIFSSGQVTAILNKMYKYSKRDRTGDFAYYAVEVKK